MLYSFVQQGKSPNSHCFFTDLESLKHFQDAARTKISKWLLLIGLFGEYYDSKGKILSKSLRFFYYFETPKQAAYLLYILHCISAAYFALHICCIFCIAYLLRILHCISVVYFVSHICCVFCITYLLYAAYYVFPILDILYMYWKIGKDSTYICISLIYDIHYYMHKTESACYPLTTPALCTFLPFLRRDSFHP